MHLTIGDPPHYPVHIEQEPSRGFINLTLTPKDAYLLLLKLNTRRSTLFDLVENYAECAECGGLHKKGISHREAIAALEGKEGRADTIKPLEIDENI